jgi:transcriptional regulator with XRE-family HTH domain
MNIADTIHMRRREKKMNESELAKKAGVSRNIVSIIERGEGNPTIQTLDAIGRALELELQVSFKPWETFQDGEK